MPLSDSDTYFLDRQQVCRDCYDVENRRGLYRHIEDRDPMQQITDGANVIAATVLVAILALMSLALFFAFSQ